VATDGVRRSGASATEVGVERVEGSSLEIGERSVLLESELAPIEIPQGTPAKKILGAGATQMYAEGVADARRSRTRKIEAARIVEASLGRLSAISGIDERFRLSFVAHQLRALLPEDTAELRHASRRNRIEETLAKCVWLPPLDLKQVAIVHLVDRLDEGHPLWSLASTDAAGNVLLSQAALKADPQVLDTALFAALLTSAIQRGEAGASSKSFDPFAAERLRLRAAWAVDLLMKSLHPTLSFDDPLKQVGGTLYYPGAGNDAETTLAATLLCPGVTRIRTADPTYRSHGGERAFQLRFPKDLEVELHAADALTFRPEASVVLLRRPGSNDSLMGRPAFLARTIDELPLGGVILGSISKLHPLLLHLPLDALGLVVRGVAGASGEQFEVLEKVRSVDRDRLAEIFEIDRAIAWAHVHQSGERPHHSMQAEPGTRVDEPLLALATALKPEDDWRPFFAMLVQRIEAQDDLRDVALEALQSKAGSKPLPLKIPTHPPASVELPPPALPGEEIEELITAARRRGFSSAAFASLLAEQITTTLPSTDWIEARLRELSPDVKIERRDRQWHVSGLPEVGTGGTYRSVWTAAPTREAALENAWRQCGLLEDGGKFLVFGALTKDERAVRWNGEKWIEVDPRAPPSFAEPQLFR
jgi:hypothetical protein